MECNGLYTAGALFPELKESKEWRRIAIETMHRESVNQYLPDGSQFELSTGYHQVATENIIGLYETGSLVGLAHEFPEDYVKRLEKALIYDITIMTPRQELPGPLNDGWPFITVPSFVGRYAPFFPKSEIIQWVVKQDSLSPPNFTSIYLPFTKFIFMRTGWSKTDHFAFMDVAALGMAHVHQDKLNVLIYPYGRERLLFDGGGGEYEISRFRDYALSSESHNTVLVDGFSQVRTHYYYPNDAIGYGNPKTPKPEFETTPMFDYASGWYIDAYRNRSYFPSNHQRELLFIKGSDKSIPMFLVVDTMTSTDGRVHNYEARWHLRTTNIDFNTQLKILATNDTDEANLAIISLSKESISRPVIAQLYPNILGYDVHRGSPASPCTTFITEQKGLNKTLINLFIPLRPGEKHNITHVEEIVSSSSYRIVMNDGNKDTPNFIIEINLSWTTNNTGHTERAIHTKQYYSQTSAVVYESTAPTPRTQLVSPNSSEQNVKPSKKPISPAPKVEISHPIVTPCPSPHLSPRPNVNPPTPHPSPLKPIPPAKPEPSIHQPQNKDYNSVYPEQVISRFTFDNFYLPAIVFFFSLMGIAYCTVLFFTKVFLRRKKFYGNLMK